MTNLLKDVSRRLWRAFGRIPIKRRLMLSFTVLLLLPMGLSYVLIIRNASVLIRQEVLLSTRRIVLNAANNMQARLQEAVAAGQVVCASTEVLGALKQLSRDAPYPLTEQLADYRAIDELLGTLQSTHGLYRLRLYVPGEPIYKNQRMNFFPLSDVRGLAWYDSLRGDPSRALVLYQRFPYIFNNTTDILSVNSMMISTDDFVTPLGLVAADIRLSDIRSMLQDMTLPGRGNAMIVDAQGHIIAEAGDLALPEGLPLRGLSANEFIEVDAGDAIGYAVALGGSGLSVWSLVDEESLMAPVRKLEQSMAAILAGMAALAYLLTMLSTSLNIDRLRLLAREMQRVMKGDLSVRVRQSAENEIGMLEKTFNYLMDSFQESLTQTVAEQQERRSAELRLLQAQIKPHFLYNTLDHLRWRALASGDQDAADFVDTLAQFYRIGLSRGQDTVPLRDEFAHAQLYIKLQNMRYDGMVQGSFHLPEPLAGCPVPGLLLQPLVENALIHGLMETPSKSGHIDISARAEGDALIVRVRDDGVGMDEQRMKDILSPAKGRSFGVWNVHSRLRLMYGEQGYLSYERESGFTVAVVHLRLDAPASAPS